MIPQSELIINPDGSIFHLHLKPHQLASTIILVGDPARSAKVAERFDTVECRVENREFVTHTGTLNSRPVSVVSTGIGCDNIDIVMTELDALFNVDFATREVKKELTQLTVVRLGTSGALVDDLKIGDYVASNYSVGIDGLAFFYDGSERVRDLGREREFVRQTNWGAGLAHPYVVGNDESLIALFDGFARRGVTVSAGGFYGPQGRVVRLGLADPNYVELMASAGVTNFEMEGAAIALLARMMGHRALTVCAIIAQRAQGNSNADYGKIVDKLIDTVLENLTK